MASTRKLSPPVWARSTWDPTTVVGTTFFIAQNVMIAFTMFFILERASVPPQWKTSMTVAAMVTGIASWNYGFMKDTWVELQESPTVYRYTDWLVTVPLLIVEFYCVLKATTKCDEGVFWRLIVASLVMLAGGYCGEVGIAASALGFGIGMAGFLYICYEIFTVSAPSCPSPPETRLVSAASTPSASCSPCAGSSIPSATSSVERPTRASTSRTTWPT